MASIYKRKDGKGWRAVVGAYGPKYRLLAIYRAIDERLFLLPIDFFGAHHANEHLLSISKKYVANMPPRRVKTTSPSFCYFLGQ